MIASRPRWTSQGASFSRVDQLEFPIDDSEDKDDGDDGGGNDDDSDLDNGEGEDDDDSDDSDGNDEDDDRVGQARSILLKTLYAGLSWNFLNCDRAFG